MQCGHLITCHSETFSNTICRYLTYDKELYVIVQACKKWKHYILGKETIIHIDHKPLQILQTQGKLKNDRHQRWLTYLQQFYLNIYHKKGSTNKVVDCLTRPPIAGVSMMLESCGHKIENFTRLCENYNEFSNVYTHLLEGKHVNDFYFQDEILFHIGQIYLP